MRVALAPSREFPRNGSEKQKKREMEKARRGLLTSSIQAARRVSLDRRRLHEAESRFNAQQQDTGAMCLPMLSRLPVQMLGTICDLRSQA